MSHFKSPTSIGVAETFLTMGLIYFAFMMFGVFTVRVPPEGWAPKGWTAPTKSTAQVTTANVTADEAIKTPQFWLLWGVLFLNVTAGIGVLAQASPMIQEVFAGKINASSAAGFVGLLSLFNLVGRFFWSSLSDRLGRRRTYMIYFGLGAVLYVLAPNAGLAGSVPAFVACFAVILSMYGGGFATIPAYLRDLFGTYQVGAIHGRLLTAWSAAAIVGPTVVTYVREAQLAHGVPKTQAYTVSLYVMAVLLVVGFVCNAAVRAVNAKHHMKVGMSREGGGAARASQRPAAAASSS
jgi:MFS family permease